MKPCTPSREEDAVKIDSPERDPFAGSTKYLAKRRVAPRLHTRSQRCFPDRELEYGALCTLRRRPIQIQRPRNYRLRPFPSLRSLCLAPECTSHADL